MGTIIRETDEGAFWIGFRSTNFDSEVEVCHRKYRFLDFGTNF